MTYRFAAFATVGAALGAVLVGIAPHPAQGQDDRRYDPPRAIIYRDAGFNGPAVALNAERPDLGLAWRVNSIRVEQGRWELCERTRFRGRCTVVTRDTARLGGLSIQSARPLRAGQGGGGGGSGGSGDVAANDRVARGIFSEFHSQPQRNGMRIRACPFGQATPSCAARTADEFCRSIGWNGSAREHLQTVNRTVYLTDVLCVRTNY